jgi:hypothetical protein
MSNSITLDRSVKARVYFVGNTFPVKDQIKRLGGHWDADRKAWWIGAAKASEAETLVGNVDPAAPKAKQDPSDIRLTGKGRYKGRTYYAGSITRDGLKVRLLTLPDDKGEYLDFWAACSEVEEIKRYEPRTHTFRGRTETQYTTLGSIASFIGQQRRAEANGEPACPVCGKRGDELHHDLETGMMCCYGCCDMPA